jgi:hypothetical protein
VKRVLLALSAVVALVAFAETQGIATPASGPSMVAGAPGQIVAMRRLTEAQYRNSIADIFGTDIVVAGRFEPIVRPQHQLIATGATSASISPAGLEQFDAMARGIAAQVFDDKHRASFVPCAPKAAALPDPACAADVLVPIGRYVYRRPLTKAEISGFVAMAGAATEKSGSFNQGLQLALASMLVSPEFLYVVEGGEPDPMRPGELRLDDYSRAARLSFLLWNSAPNDMLLSAAERGDLRDPTKLDAIARRMVGSPRFEQGVRAFFADMLLFEKFDELAKDPIVFPRYNPEVGKALPEQMLRTIVDQLVTRSGDYRELFTTRRTFLTRALGAVYQMPVRTQTGWEPQEFDAEDDRAGLLSQAGFLALYSHSGRSSPTLRGRAVRELLLCSPVPNPPGNVNFTAVQDINSKTMPTARNRLAVHNSDPVCAGCHAITDPIGLSLERFDGIGSWRKTENGALIDVAAKVDDTNVLGAAGLGKALAANPAATECVANRALEYATGRSTDDEVATLAALQKAFAASGYKIADLFLQVATMPDAWRVPSKPLGAPPQVALLNPGARP